MLPMLLDSRALIRGIDSDFPEPAPAPAFDADADAGEATPTAALVDVMTSDLERRTQLVKAVVCHLPDDARERMAPALKLWGEAGSRLAAVATDPHSPASALAVACRILARRLALVEEMSWRALVEEIRSVERQGGEL